LIALSVDEEVEPVSAVCCARAGVAAGGFQAGVPEELGDDHAVGPAADERRREGVPKDVGGRIVVEAGAAARPVITSWAAPRAQALPPLVEKQRRGLGAGPAGPAGECSA